MTSVPIEHIAKSLEDILNAPFTKEGKPKKHDIYQDVSNLQELAFEVTKDRSLIEQFAKECYDVLVSQFTPRSEAARGGLRVSKLGKEPIIQAFDAIGVKTDTGCDNLWIVIAGHLFEAWTRFVLRARGFDVDYDAYGSSNEVSYQGITGHYDFVLTTKLGRRIVCEVKHLSTRYVDNLLDDERTENPKTGNMVKTGKKLSTLSNYAFSNDDRGYLTQLSVYSEALEMDGLFIIWDKGTNRCHVVPLPEFTKKQCLARVGEVLPELRNVKTVSDVLENFEVPAPQPQKAKGQPTGRFYVPFVMRYLDPRFVDALYETDDEGWCLGVREPLETLRRGKNSGLWDFEESIPHTA